MAETQLVVGRGELYFDRFADGALLGTGERYLGNTPTFTLTQAATKLDHFDSDHGLKQKDRSVTLTSDLTGATTTDNVVAENLALFFLGDATPLTVAQAAAVKETIILAIPGRVYQLGVSDDQPSGARGLDNVVVALTAAGHAAVDPSNYLFDGATGRLEMLVGGDGFPAEGASIDVTYDQTAYTRDAVIAEGSEVYGALRFVADNAVGLNRDAYMPYVQLTSNGDYGFKGDDWQVMGFTIEVLKLRNRQKLYIDGRPFAG